MTYLNKFLAIALLVFSLGSVVTVGDAQAQSCGEECYFPTVPPTFQPPTIPAPTFQPPLIQPPVFIPPIVVGVPVGPSVKPQIASPQATNAFVQELSAATDFCSRLQSGEYTVDCLGDALQQLAEAMPKTGDYAQAQAAIDQAAVKLRSLALVNASTTLPRGRVVSTGEDARRSSTPLTPVSTESIDVVKQMAIEIMEETETILLRSAESSAGRKSHYEQIALAVGSNKVLLRSL